MHITGYLSLAGVQYPYDVTLTSGQSASFSNAGCSYHIEVTQNGTGDTAELWVDSFTGANLPMYGKVVVIPGVPFGTPKIYSRCSTANVNRFADVFYDAGQSLAIYQLATPWTPSSADLSGYAPKQSFGLGISNTSGFTAPALYLGYSPAYTVLPIDAPNQSITCYENSIDASVTPAITSGGNPVTGASLAIIQGPTNGSARVSGEQLLYTPRPGFFGADSFTYKATSGGVDSNVATVSVIVTPAACAELGRVTRIYASGYERTRVHDARLVRGESRCLVVEFNGAIPPTRTVASVTWRCVDPSVVVMSNARIQPGARSVAIDVRANWPRDTLIKCEATLDNGEVYVQLIHLDVTDSWWFGDETAVSGPMVLIA